MRALMEFKAHKGKQGYVEAVDATKNPTAFAVLLKDSVAMCSLLVATTGPGLSQLTSSTM